MLTAMHVIVLFTLKFRFPGWYLAGIVHIHSKILWSYFAVDFSSGADSAAAQSAQLNFPLQVVCPQPAIVTTGMNQVFCMLCTPDPR
jgi:hypothetical protein